MWTMMGIPQKEWIAINDALDAILAIPRNKKLLKDKSKLVMRVFNRCKKKVALRYIELAICGERSIERDAYEYRRIEPLKRLSVASVYMLRCGSCGFQAWYHEPEERVCEMEHDVAERWPYRKTAPIIQRCGGMMQYVYPPRQTSSPVGWGQLDSRRREILAGVE